MKLLKYIFITLVIIIAIPMLLALFVKNDYAIESEVIINRPKDQVFDYIKYLKNHDDFNTWAQQDTLMRKSYEGTDGKVGFVYKWESDSSDVGSGEQEIKAISDGDRIDYQLRFIEPMESTSTAYMSTEMLSEVKTKVRWGFEGHMDYPLNALLLFMDMESMLKEDLQKGLNALKIHLEAQPSVTAMGTKIYLKKYYEKISDTLYAQIDELTSDQLHFKPAADKWSIGQCLDHIIKSEQLLLDIIKKEMEKAPQPQLLDSIGVSDQQIKMQLADRTKTYQAPKTLAGIQKYQEVDKAITDYKEVEKTIFKFIDSVNINDMRSHHSVYPFGNSDVYQAVMSLAAHTSRHTAQIKQVKSDPAFPKK